MVCAGDNAVVPVRCVRVTALLCLGLVAGLSSGSAQVLEEPEWMTRRRHLISGTSQRAAETITPAAVAQQYKLQWPVSPPTASLEDIKHLARADLRAAAEQEIPDLTAQALRGKLEKQYPPWQIGDSVEFRLLSRTGKGDRIRGLVTAIHPNIVRVNGRWLHPADMPEDVVVRFFPDRLDGMVEKEFLRRERTKEADRRAYVEANLAEALKAACAKHGYIKLKGDWYSIFRLVQRLVDAKRRQAVEAELNVVMTEAGFEKYEKEWLPPELAQARREQAAASAVAAAPVETPVAAVPTTPRPAAKVFTGVVTQILDKDIVMMQHIEDPGGSVRDPFTFDTYVLEMSTQGLGRGVHLQVEVVEKGTHTYDTLLGATKRVPKLKVVRVIKMERER